jgi:tRNA modification GTPase
MLKSDNIAAICTPPGKSGIGIIRISGPDPYPVIAPFIPNSKALPNPKKIKIRKLFYTKLINLKKEMIDEVLIAAMPTKRSFTAEPTIEIHCHGGLINLKLILEQILANGARLAKPGEFSYRAVINGRLTINQAEAINDLINAHSSRALTVALRQLTANQMQPIHELRDKFAGLLSIIQSLIDFGIETDDELLNEIQNNGIELIRLIKNMHSRILATKHIHNGFQIILLGPPNAGKSSLFNAILNAERSLVCEIAGTTRDHISESMEIDGSLVKIFDSAGIRHADDRIEKDSIRRTVDLIPSMDLILFVVDSSEDIDLEQLSFMNNLSGKLIYLILNKSDLQEKLDNTLLIERIQPAKIIRANAYDPESINHILLAIGELINSSSDKAEFDFSMNIRQENVFKEIHEIISGNSFKFPSALHNLDVLQSDIQAILRKIGCILGDISENEISEKIFSRFCIGK